MKVNWHKRFVDLSRYISTWSKDRNTKVGAVITDKDHRALSMGYNGFPTGFNDDIDSRHERPIKYLYSEHAERNAIFSAVKNGISLKDSTIYSTLFPCADCARAIIQSGINTVVSMQPDYSNKQWGSSFTASFEMLVECGINIIFMD